MLPTKKFHNFSRSTKFILVICSSDIVVVTLFTNLIYLSSTFMKLIWEMRDVDFMNNVLVALSNEEMIKINFVDLEKLYNFVVEKFFIWIHLGPQKLLWKTDLPRTKKCTRQNTSLPSAKKRHSAKTHFAVCRKIALGKIHICRVPEKGTRQRRILSSVFFAECILFSTRQRRSLPSAQ